MKRRRFLQYAGVSATALTLPIFSHAANVQKQLLDSDQFCLFTIDDVNSLAVKTNEGLVVVDSGSSANAKQLGQALEDFSAANNKLAVNTLFNTHYHADQCGGNELLGKAGAKIVAHKKTQLSLSTDYYIPHEQRYHRALPKAAQPTVTFYEQESFSLGGIAIDAGYFIAAHTMGDIYVRFKDANIICAGDVVSPLRDPKTDWYAGAWLGGRRDSLDLLLSLCDDNTKIIPAYGKVMSKQEVQQERDFIVAIYEEISLRVRDGQTAKDMLDGGIMAKFERELKDPYQFLYDANKGFWGHYNKIGPNIV